MAASKKIKITARQSRGQSPNPKYFRAGLVLTPDDREYEVTAEQLAILKGDRFVKVTESAVKEPATPKADDKAVK